MKYIEENNERNFFDKNHSKRTFEARRSTLSNYVKKKKKKKGKKGGEMQQISYQCKRIPHCLEFSKSDRKINL